MKKLFTIISGILISILGPWGGIDEVDKSFRRLGIPIIMAVMTCWRYETFYFLWLLTLIAPFTVGYGMPGGNSKGSALGRFFYKLTNQNYFITNHLTRATKAILLSLPLISIPLYLGNWTVYIFGTIIFSIVSAIFWWRNLGIIRIIWWTNISDLIVYTTYGLFFVKLIA